MAYLNDKARAFPVHREHLIERIGLFAIIVLGETVIRIVGSFTAREQYDIFDAIAAAAGFLLIVQVWWIYFGALYLLERAKRIQSGLVVLVSNLLLYVGIIFLANLTGHAINGDINPQTFSMLGVTGAVLFYLGKQIPYFMAYPPLRVPTVVNTLVCLGITVIATFLPRPEYSLLMMCFGMFVYVQLNLRWTIPLHNVDAYTLVEETA
jgi:low temperature requirement protein LtrA